MAAPLARSGLVLLVLRPVLARFPLAALGAIGAGMVRMDFFAADTIRLFYVNVEMPPATPLLDWITRRAAQPSATRRRHG